MRIAMRLQTLQRKLAAQSDGVLHPLQDLQSEPSLSRHGLCKELAWRHPATFDNRAADADVLVSRWVDPNNSCRHEKAMSWSDRHTIGIALKTARLSFTRGSHIVFEGIMPAGTLHITGPSQPLTAEFLTPYDFIHFHVANDYLRQRRDAAQKESCQPLPDLNDLVIRDPLSELLGRTLIEDGNGNDRSYVESIGHSLVMHIARLELRRPAVNALPKWRLKRVRQYVDAHLDKTISLADMATAAGLSRMHFAAQFRAATGLRPHDYLLNQRVESAKALLSRTDTPLAEIALTVGFLAQAHFSTVFKRFTGETPARWRRCNETFGNVLAGPSLPRYIGNFNQQRGI
jgi:AraC family transcriptional regulator